MSAPAIQQVSQPGSFDTLKEQNQIFFTFVGPRAGSLWNAYSSVAVKFQSHVYFYATNEEIAKKHFQNASVPSILVHKEKTHYFFERKYSHILYVHVGMTCFFIFVMKSTSFYSC